jgi:hypothetical protein
MKPSISEADVTKLATRFHWRRVSDIPASPDRAIGRQVAWEIAEILALHYIEDAIGSWRYLVVSGADKRAAEAVAAVVREHLDHWSVQGLIERVRAEDDLAERARLIVGVGLAAPKEFNESVYTLIDVSMRDSEKGIRYAALWAAAYTEYRELVPAIANMARNEPIQAIQERAEIILEAFGDGSDDDA